MSLQDFLKGLFSGDITLLPNFKGFIVIENNNSNNKVRIDEVSGSATIDISSLNDAEQAELKALIPRELPEFKHIIDRSSREAIENIRLIEGQPENASIISYFSGILHHKDILILRQCLPLKSSDCQSIQCIKQRLTAKYGARGQNIANLCSQGYYDIDDDGEVECPYQGWFKSLHQGCLHLHEDNTEEALSVFLRYYELIVSEMPWTIFVHRNHQSEDIQVMALAKLKQNSEYGSPFLYVHTIGKKNIQKVKELSQYLEAEIPNIVCTENIDGVGASLTFKIPRKSSGQLGA